MPRFITMASVWLLLEPALLPVVACGAGMKRDTEVEPAFRRIVVGEALVELPHTVDVVVDRLRDGVRQTVGHRGRDDDGRAHGRGADALGGGRLGIGPGWDHALVEPEPGEVLHARLGTR